MRPRLGWHREGWGIFARAVLGATLITTLVVAPMIWAVGPPARPAMLLGAGVGLGLLIVAGTVVGCARGVADGLATCVAEGPAYAVAMSLGFAVIPGGGWDALAARSLALAGLLIVAVGLSAGWGRGIYIGLTSGAPGRMGDIVTDAFLLTVPMVGPTAHSVVAFLAGMAVICAAFVAGGWLGGRWSTRRLDRGEV